MDFHCILSKVTASPKLRLQLMPYLKAAPTWLEVLVTYYPILKLDLSMQKVRSTLKRASPESYGFVGLLS